MSKANLLHALLRGLFLLGHSGVELRPFLILAVDVIGRRQKMTL